MALKPLMGVGGRKTSTSPSTSGARSSTSAHSARLEQLVRSALRPRAL